MACSRFEYVKSFELNDNIIPNVWIVIRIDGKGFHKFSKVHGFSKPNDENALNLMNTAAVRVMQEVSDVVIAFGQSDEYSFVLRKGTQLYKRRAAKLLTYVTSLFSSAYVMHWPTCMPHMALRTVPSFDGRVVIYPTDENLRDYLSWRQADVHVNNLYNTAFWNLVNSGMSNYEAQEKLKGTLSAQKNELLFSEFQINYNEEPAQFRKGTILLRKRLKVALCESKLSQVIIALHEDLIGKNFWSTHSEILQGKSAGIYECDQTILNSSLMALQLREHAERAADCT